MVGGYTLYHHYGYDAAQYGEAGSVYAAPNSAFTSSAVASYNAFTSSASSSPNIFQLAWTDGSYLAQQSWNGITSLAGTAWNAYQAAPLGTKILIGVGVVVGALLLPAAFAVFA